MATTTPPSAPRRPPAGLVGALVGLLVGSLIVWYAVLLGVQSLTVGLPSPAASRFVPPDGYREQATFVQDGFSTKAMVENARIIGPDLIFTMSPQAFRVIDEPAEGVAAASWWREATVPGDITQPPRYRVRSLDAAGVWLRVQDWEDRGLSFEHLLELPADVAAGQTWSSSGVALGKPTDRHLTYRNTSVASQPGDAARSAQSCLDVSSDTELTSSAGVEHLHETNLWCPGAGVVENRGAFRGDYTVLPAAGLYGAVPVEDLKPAAWDAGALERWTVRPTSLVAGDATFGSSDAQVIPSTQPAFTPDGLLVVPLDGDPDLSALIPQRSGTLWWHWWAHPGGDVVSTAVVGSLVLVTTTKRQLLAYTAGGRFRWGVELDDVAVVPPLALAGNRLAVATVGGSVSVFDLSTGTRRWQAQLDRGVHSPLSASNTVLVAADAGPATTAWDIESGHQLWSNDAGSAFGTSLAASEDRVLVAALGIVTAYEARTGVTLWSRKSGLGLGSSQLSGARLLVQVDQRTEAWSVASGRTLWALPQAALVVEPEHRCLTGDQHLDLLFRGSHLLAVDATGAVRHDWALQAQPKDTRSVHCADGRLWVTSFGPTQSLRVESIGPP